MGICITSILKRVLFSCLKEGDELKKYEKLVQEAFLNDEEAVIRRLKQVYNKSLEDITKKAKELQDQINTLDALEGMTSDAAELAKLKSMKQAKVYQRDYQKALKTQISSILDELHVNEFKTVSDYLNKCYEQGFLGAMYSLQQQGIPLIMPMDQEAMVRAVQLDSKISEGLYTRLGEDVTLLKRKITAQVSRGISTGMSFQQVAQQLAGYTNIGFNNAVRITRTEGHRIQVQSTNDACYKAKEKGADVVKQWDASLDKRTRPSHARVDGEIRELDEKFSNGLMFPGDPNGGAAEVINCRCALLQRARWALDDDELDTLKDRASYFGLDKNDSFEDFKKKYLNAVEEANKTNLTERRKQRLAERRKQQPSETNANIVKPDFGSIDRKEIQTWASENLNTEFIDIKGANIDFVREAMDAVYEFEQKMGGRTIDGLKVKFGGTASNEYAHYEPKTNTLFLKKTGSIAKLEESQKGNNLRYRIKWKKDMDYHATTSYRGTVFHELGHAVDHDKDQNLSRMLSSSADLNVKSVKVSSAAGKEGALGATKRSEAWAENFAAYMEGNENAKRVPAEIVDMIEDYFKKKRNQ